MEICKFYTAITDLSETGCNYMLIKLTFRALENTLRLMNGRNENYRKSFNKVDQTSEEFEEKEKLEEQLRAVMEKYKFKRRQIREVQEDLETMNGSLTALAKDEQDLVELLKERETKMAHLENELNDQKAKQERTRKHNSRMVRDIRSAQKVKGETHEERDIELREIRDFNTDIMKQIGVVVQTHGDMSAATQLYFNQAGLPAPPSPSRLGSRPSSVQSSRSSSLASNR
jgi:UDP-glucose:O-linked fucose beta-1,3-glucosyltransferase